MKAIFSGYEYETQVFGQGSGSKTANSLTETQTKNVKKPLIFYSRGIEQVVCAQERVSSKSNGIVPARTQLMTINAGENLMADNRKSMAAVDF